MITLILYHRYTYLSTTIFVFFGIFQIILWLRMCSGKRHAGAIASALFVSGRSKGKRARMRCNQLKRPDAVQAATPQAEAAQGRANEHGTKQIRPPRFFLRPVSLACARVYCSPRPFIYNSIQCARVNATPAPAPHTQPTPQPPRHSTRLHTLRGARSMLCR